MAAAALTYNLDQPDLIHLEGDDYLVTGTITTDTGDYAAGGLAIVPSTFGLDTYETFILGPSSIATIHTYFIPGASYILGKIKLFKEDGTTGIEAEHAASALTAQTWPFIAIGRKAK
jgi:hypothetical protein